MAGPVRKKAKKTITVWIKYESKGSYEVEVDEDFEVPSSISDWPDGWVGECDADAHEQTPTDWGSDS